MPIGVIHRNRKTYTRPGLEGLTRDDLVLVLLDLGFERGRLRFPGGGHRHRRALLLKFAFDRLGIEPVEQYEIEALS